MKPPFKLELASGISSLLTIRKWGPKSNKDKLQYANSKLMNTESSKIFRQYFRGFTFYMEQVTYYVKKPDILKIIAKRPCLIFIYVITGDIHAAVTGHKEFVVIEKRQCFAHLMPAGDYSWLLENGKKKIIYFTLKPEWLLKMRSEYPELAKFIQTIQKGDVPNKILPSYTMTVKTLIQLDRLMNCKAKSKVELEEMLFNTINKLVKEYQEYLTAPNQVVYKSNNQIAYEVRDHILNLVGQGIIPFVIEVSATFNIEKRTLGRFCNSVFKMNVQELITDAQMKKAYAMLKRGRSVKDVTLGLGYSDTSVFCRKFKIYFGYSPGTVVSDSDS